MPSHHYHEKLPTKKQVCGETMYSVIFKKGGFFLKTTHKRNSPLLQCLLPVHCMPRLLLMSAIICWVVRSHSLHWLWMSGILSYIKGHSLQGEPPMWAARFTHRPGHLPPGSRKLPPCLSPAPVHGSSIYMGISPARHTLYRFMWHRHSDTHRTSTSSCNHHSPGAIQQKKKERTKREKASFSAPYSPTPTPPYPRRHHICWQRPPCAWHQAEQ